MRKELYILEKLREYISEHEHYPNKNQLQMFTGLHRDTVTKYIEILVEKRLIKRVKWGKRWIYKIQSPKTHIKQEN